MAKVTRAQELQKMIDTALAYPARDAIDCMNDRFFRNFGPYKLALTIDL